MNKLKLDLAALQVESFAAASGSERAGTVAAREVGTSDEWTVDLGDGGGAYTVGTCIGPTFCCAVSWKPSCMSCEGTCGNSCGGSCEFTCRPGDSCPT
jgi:hypothetical protein